MPREPNGNVNETLSLRKRFGAMWMSWIREYFACLAGLPLFPVGSSWFVFVLRLFKSSHNFVHCKSWMRSCFPFFAFRFNCLAGMTFFQVNLDKGCPMLISHISDVCKTLLYSKPMCVHLGWDTLWYIACLQRLWGSAEARSSTKACPQSRPMNVEMECFHYSASNFTKLEAAPMEQ